MIGCVPSKLNGRGRSIVMSFFRAFDNGSPGSSNSLPSSAALSRLRITGANVSVRDTRPTASEQAVKAEHPQNIHRQDTF